MSGTILLILRIILIVVSYAFVGWSIWLLWRDLSRQSNLLATRQPPLLSVERDVDGDPQPVRFRTTEVILGRDPACDYTISDSTVSARHTRLSFRNGHWWVEDLRSTNGTFLNMEAVDEPVVITTGDQIRCGQVNLKLTISTAHSDNEQT